MSVQTHRFVSRWSAACSLAFLVAATLLAGLPPTELPALRQGEPFFPNAEYRKDIPTPEQILGFRLTTRAATPEQIAACLKAWTDAAPDRARLVEYARSHEDRPLYYVIVTAPAHLTRLPEIRAGMARLADPRDLSEAEAERLIKELPAVAWLACTIHGDETEGSDAALALLYYLIASDDPEARRLREQLVVIVDPLMNPDGRARFLKMVAEARTVAPNLDDQSLLHTGYWPRGRGNHYLFDLNRDWILGVHPETRGRIREVGRWNPVLFVDAHGMGPQETHLFSPPREPINPNIPHTRSRWGELFAREQARAFDQHGLLYYTGEWHEEWYPGYSDGYASYRGAIGILYEQARIAEDGVRRPEGRILTYHESVQHHVIGFTANLKTAAAHRADLLRNFLQVRREAVAETGPYAQRTFAVLPSKNRSRFRAFVELMQLEGFELYELTRPTQVRRATDQLGHSLTNVTLPEGTLLLPNRQPLAHLLAAMLEFDPHQKTNVLAEERRELLLKGESKIYDTTAWNLTMFYGLPALTLPQGLPEAARPWPSTTKPLTPVTGETAKPIAYIFDGADDASVTAAARLMERGVEVRAAEKPFAFGDRHFERGSIVVARLDNRGFAGDLAAVVAQVARECQLPAVGVNTGLGRGDLPDLGGSHFRRLERPRIALLGREKSSPYDYGAVWHLIDHRLAIRHTHLADLKGRDLRRYNVIILPDGKPTDLDTLKPWVADGGTLIAIASAIEPLAQTQTNWCQTRLLPDVLDQLDDYELAVFREWLGHRSELPDLSRVWSHAPSPEVSYPWQDLGGKRPEATELKRRDKWQKLFMPQGAFVAARVDTNHWLTAGCDTWLPVLVGDQPVLMAKPPVEAPVRYGVFERTPADKGPPGTSSSGSATATAASGTDSHAGSDKEKKEPARIGFAALPPETVLRLRMSGLIWPEATHRLANAAWCTRQRHGRGQIILFATPPAFRGTARATARILLNAIVCGPGWGTTPRIQP